VTKLIALLLVVGSAVGSLNLGWPVVDQTTMTTPGVSHPSPTTAEDFRRVLDERAVQPVFQPLVDLDNRHVLGYEALARGPMGSALESPAALFEPPTGRGGSPSSTGPAGRPPSPRPSAAGWARP
jgi:hypothetical protein